MTIRPIITSSSTCDTRACTLINGKKSCEESEFSAKGFGIGMTFIILWLALVTYVISELGNPWLVLVTLLLPFLLMAFFG